MCGLFAVLTTPRSRLNEDDVDALIAAGRLAQRRGSDASGLVLIDADRIDVAKANQAFATLLQTHEGQDIVGAARKLGAEALFGHSRLETHGYSGSLDNNQPIVVGSWLVVHNGVITNEAELRSACKIDASGIETDTAVISMLLEEWDQGGREGPVDAVFERLRGEYSVIAASSTGDLLCRTNVGNLYREELGDGTTILASEPRQLPNPEQSRQLPLETTVWFRQQGHDRVEISQVGTKLGTEGMEGAMGLHLNHGSLDDDFVRQMDRVSEAALEHAASLRRCTRCVLPETFPGLDFDANGVCLVCRDFTIPQYAGLDALEADLRDMSPDGRSVLACLSGGRDSCYILHLLCEMGFKPTAYTYDWGMVTTAARENMSRMCGDLHVEHVVVSPDIRRNRRRINKALHAWLKHPRIGTIPILMAGDKPYFRWAGGISKERGNLPAVMADHPLETTGFKSMLAGAKPAPSPEGGVSYRLSTTSLCKMVFSYASHATRSPGLFPSLAKEGTRGFIDYYLGKHEFVRPFSYIPWDEAELETTLRGTYDWSADEKRSSTSWRMGDGTAPFYNLMYLLGLGMTEHDALRSNQVRFGLATREESIERLAQDNRLNVLGLASYFATVGIDYHWAGRHIADYARRTIPGLS